MGASTSRSSNSNTTDTGNDNGNTTTATTTSTTEAPKEATNDTKQKQIIAYFNNAGKTALPPSVTQIGLQSVHNESQPWLLPSSNDDTPTKIRQQFSKLINASSRGKDVAIVPSTSFALTLTAHNLYRTGKIKSRDKILILQDEMSSQVYCWQEICNKCGATLEIIPHPTTEKGGWTDLIVNKLLENQNEDDKIAVVCIPQVHYSDGSLINLSKIGSLCYKQNMIFIVDATQSVGIYPINIQELKCHILTASVHKWLLGPHGCSLLYISPEYHEKWVPLDQHERCRVAFQDETYNAGKNVVTNEGYPEEFVDGAAKLDSGGKKNPVLLPMVLEGLNIVNTLDLVECQAQLKNMTDSILHRMSVIGLNIQPGPRLGHIIGLRPNQNLDKILTPPVMVQIEEKLKSQGIVLAVRSGAFRIAPYLNTSQEEIDCLVDGLSKEIERVVKSHKKRECKEGGHKYDDSSADDMMADWEIIS